MWFVDIRVTCVVVIAIVVAAARAFRVAAEPTDDRLDAVRLPALAALLAVLHIVGLQSIHTSASAQSDRAIRRIPQLHWGWDVRECMHWGAKGGHGKCD